MKTNSIAKNAFFKLLLNLFNVVVPIVIGSYVARKLGSDMLGTVNFAQSLYGYFYIFAGFGIYNYGLRELSRKRHNEKELRQTFTSLFMVTIITNSLVTIIYIFFINQRYAGQPVASAAMILTFNLIFNIFYTEWVNEAIENYAFISIKTIIVRVIYLILLFALVKSADDWRSYVYLLVFSTAANNILSFIHIKRRVKFDFSNIEILKHIKPMFFVVILSNANVLYTQLDKLMLGEYISKSSVSFYVMAQNVMTVVNSLVLTVISVSLPRLSSYLSTDKNDEYLKMVNKLSKIMFWFLFPIAFGIIVLSKEIMSIYGGTDFVSAGPVLLVFGIYMITLGYEFILSNQIMYLNNKEKIQVVFLFIGGGINLILNIILLKMEVFTAETSILTTTIANTIFIIMEYVYIRLRLKINIGLFKLDKLKYMFIAAMFIPITLIIKIKFTNTILVVLISVVVNAVYYYAVLLLTKDSVTYELMGIGVSKIKESYKKIKRS